MSDNPCCSYPHGEGLIIPQAFMIGAVFCNMMMFSVTKFLTSSSYDFLCIVIEYGLDTYYESSPSTLAKKTLKSCGPLKMFRTDYWWDDGSSKFIEGEQQGFAGAAQAGAFFGAAATAIGVLTLVV
eukprot:674314_1